MTVTQPYCTTRLVVYLVRTLWPSALPYDFTATTTPTKDEVEQILLWIGGEIDMALAEFGYKLPLNPHPDDTVWPDTQTYFLSFLEGIGTAGYISTILKPMPATAPGKDGTQGNIYYSKYQTSLNKIRESGAGLRADFYPGTTAEKKLRHPRAPMLDFHEGAYDPTRYQLLEEFTKEFDDVRRYASVMGLSWNYMHTLSGAGMPT